jgi:hypothetical protein
MKSAAPVFERVEVPCASLILSQTGNRYQEERGNNPAQYHGKVAGFATIHLRH